MSSPLVRAFVRFVGLLFTLLGGWIFTVNIFAWILAVNMFGDSYSGSVLAWIIFAGASGAVGGVLYLLSFDGPNRFRTRTVRLTGWVGMLVLGLLPWSFGFLMIPLLLLTIPTLSTKGLSQPVHKPTTA